MTASNPHLAQNEEAGAAATRRETPETTNASVWRDVCFAGRLCRRYLLSADWRWAFGLVLVMVLANAAQVWLMVRTNTWLGEWMGALANIDRSAFMYQCLIGAAIAAVSSVLIVISEYFRQMLQIRWRHCLTDDYLRRWLDHNRFHAIEAGSLLENPDQRISDDVKQVVDVTLTLAMGTLSMAGSLGSFSYLLWNNSGPLAFTIFGLPVVIPAYLLWLAFAYSIVSAWLTHLVGKVLTRGEVRQQQFEADFRFDLIRVREYSEQIAFYRGANFEQIRLQEGFAVIQGNWMQLMWYRFRLNVVVNVQSQLQSILPTMITAQRLFSGAINYTTLMQLNGQFGSVVSSMSWFIASYATIASWRALLARLHLLEDVLRSPAAPGMVRINSPVQRIAVRGLRVCHPDGRPLVAVPELHIAPGERLLIKGPSGSGKSTLLRAMAGLWPHATGEIAVPEGVPLMFLPQKNYLPIGTLRAALSYPAEATAFSAAQVAEVLAAVQLAHLTARLEERADWSKRLSPGEQQRLAVARALLQQPAFLFVDEATSALDPELETLLYTLLTERLPKSAIVSVAHRPALLRFHTRVASLDAGALVETRAPATDIPHH